MATDRTTVSAAHGEVPEAFDEVADRYDLMVALNPGYHAHLRRSARDLVARLPQGQTCRILDLGSGSGASTRALVDELDRADVRAEEKGAFEQRLVGEADGPIVRLAARILADARFRQLG